MALKPCFTPKSLYWSAAIAAVKNPDYKTELQGLGNIINDIKMVSCVCFKTESAHSLKENVYINALNSGHFECFKKAFEIGVVWSTQISTLASKLGALPFLVFAHENGCPWDENTCIEASKNKQKWCMYYAMDNGCPNPGVKHLFNIFGTIEERAL